MAESGQKAPTTIKKYANRRLYHTGTSSYVTLEDLAVMVRQGENFVVTDAKSGEDITRAVLGQIIFEQENKGQFLLPITFLRQLIRFYGDNMQALVPRYLEFSLERFMSDQQKLREQMQKSFGAGFVQNPLAMQNPFQFLEEQSRQNMVLFEETMRAFASFSRLPAGQQPEGGESTPPAETKPAARKPKG